jgi:hypothetical protein
MNIKPINSKPSLKLDNEIRKKVYCIIKIKGGGIKNC